MYAAPRVIETKIFATLPEELRFQNRTNELSKFVEGEFDSFLEGPSFDRVGPNDLVFSPAGWTCCSTTRVASGT